MAKTKTKTETVKTDKADSFKLVPHITERASAQALDENHPVYAFLITPATNKSQVRAVIKARYGVTPVKLATINGKPKKIIVRGRVGYQSGVKKVLVYLKKGDKITV